MGDERPLYEPLKAALERHIMSRLAPKYADQRLQTIARLKPPSEKIYLEVTADKGLSNELKSRISPSRDLIYRFIEKKDARPDLTGFIEINHISDFIVVELKDETLVLDNIYQLKKYADLLDSKYSLLVSTDEIPAEIKRLKNVIPDLLSRSAEHNALTLIHYDTSKHVFLDWFPGDPFPTWKEDPELTPKLSLKFKMQSKSKEHWEIPFVITNENEFSIRIYQILVNGLLPDADRVQLNLGGDETLQILRLMNESEENYLYDADPHSSHDGKLMLSKRWFREGEKIRVATLPNLIERI